MSDCLWTCTSGMLIHVIFGALDRLALRGIDSRCPLRIGTDYFVSVPICFGGKVGCFEYV